MAADTTIAALFDLSVVAPPLCDQASCKSVVDYISKFSKYAEDETCRSWMNKTELGALDTALKTLAASGAIEWMPDYGCALMKSTEGCPSGEIALNLIALDLHRFQSTSKLSSTGYDYVDTAFATEYEVLPIGICTMEELPNRQSMFKGILSSAQNRSGNSRSARSGKQGHQRTPAFIHALYRQAFTSVEELPRGGMTDVGLHSGGEQRSTAGPLVFFSLHQLLLDYEASSEQPFSSDALFKKIVSYFGLFVSEMTIQQYDDKASTNSPRSNAPDALLEHAFHIIRSASIKAADYSDEGLDMAFFVDWSKSIQGKIMQRSSEASAKYSIQFQLPQSDAGILGQYENFCFNLPPPYSHSKDGSLSESEIHKNESLNLGWLPVLDKRGLEDIRIWVKKSMPATKQDPLLSIMVMKTIEGLMWGYAIPLPEMKQDELEAIAAIVDDYREVLYHFKVSSKYLPLSLVQLKSRELLVVWVTFCVFHSNAERLHRAEMQGFGVPLDFNNLSHLVLSSREEWKVAKHVAIYLSKYGTNKPLFSLKDEQPTFDMGRRVANASPRMLKIWEDETQDALGRVEGHWQEVQRKKDQARRLRAEIAELIVERADANRKLASKRNDLAEHERKERDSPLYSWITYNSYQHIVCENEVATLTGTISRLDLQLSSKNSSLQSALKAPAPVIQPLPKERNNAVPVIFFLYMPPVFQLLSRFSFTAQQVLIPQPWTSVWGGSEGSEKVDITSLVTRRADQWCQLSLKDHYNTYQDSQYHSPSSSRRGSDYHLLLRSLSNSVPRPKDIGPGNVDNMHNKSDGIWHPDQLRHRMAWFGGTKSFDSAPSGCEINPFASLDHFYLVLNFTERLANDEHLQWTMVQPGDDQILRSRGNLPYARQNMKPSWLSKTEYLSFCTMRSHPNIQLRNILVAIQERQLPLHEASVHALINQTLFHLGDLSVTNSCATLEWKRDLEDSGFCNGAHVILHSFYDEIKDTPKNYRCVKILGRLCNFFSAWELAESVYGWAEDLGDDIENSPPSLAPEIRAKQVALYQNAVVALSGGSLTKSDVALLLKMLVKSRNLFTGDNRLGEIQANDTEVKYELSQKLDDMLQASPTAMTTALRSVFRRCPRTDSFTHYFTPQHVHSSERRTQPSL